MGKVKWTYNGKNYVLYRSPSNIFYLNNYFCSEGNEILEGLKNTATANEAKQRAEFLDSQPKDMKNRIDIYRPPTTPLEKTGKNMLSAFVFILALGVIGGVLYLIFQLWWIFVGDWAFDGPWADDVSAGEVAFDTIIFFIAFIVVIEEVIRRCINGHF